MALRSGVFFLAALCAVWSTSAAASAAGRTWPPDGKYHYDILASGTAAGSSDVTVTSDATSVSAGETLTQGPARVTTSARYVTPSLALITYAADIAAPGVSQHTTVTVKPGALTVMASGQSVDIRADAAAPLLIIGDNFIASAAMVPAILHANGATSFTLAVLRGGVAVVAAVTVAPAATRPAGLPANDVGYSIAVAGVHEILWYDPQTFVLDDLVVPEQALDVRRALGAQHAQAGTPAAAPQPLPLPPQHFSSRDVTFVSADGTTLAGTLTVPDAAPAPLPAVVLVHGSGPMDRNETIGPNPVFLQLSNALSNAGYVVLRYDKRGVGQSGGTRDGATRPQLLADATAAYTFVAAQPQVDAQRVFMLGHSEGGELVPTVAANTGAPAGIILMAPPALPLWQISMRQVLASAPPAQEAAARKAELAALAEIRDGSNRSPGMAWYRSSMDVDPVVDIARVACPVLILQGAADVQVAPSDLPRLLAAAKAAHRNVTSYVFPHDNHLFMTVPAGEPATPQAAVHQYLTVPGRIDPDVLAAMLGWLKSTSAAAPAKAA